MRAAEQSVAAMIASQDNVSASARKPKTEETHYDTRLTDSQIRSVLGSLRNSILSRLDTASADAAGDTTGQRKLVLFVRDATDMLETDSVDGRKIIVGLMDLVRMLRQDYRVPVLLVAGCSPSLANTGNLEKDASFYATLFDGSGTLVNTNDGYAHQNIWVDGKLFETPLDSLTDEFEKIDLLPPSPVGAYLDQMLPSETSVSAQSTNTNGAAASGIDVSRSGRNARSNTRVASSCSPSAASAATAATTAATAKTSDQAAASTLTPVHGSTFSDLVEGLDQITLHIEALQRDLRLRLREINWRNFEAACSRRGVQLRGLDAMQIANPTEALMDHIQFPPDFQLLLGMLEVGVWPTLRINRLVTLAMACRMELSLRNGVAPPATLDVSAQQLLEALRVMYQLDLVRLSRNNAIQSLEEGDEGEITPATVSFSSSTSTSSRVASSASSATPTAGSTAASTSASVSTVPRVASAAGGSASGFTGSSATAANAASDASTLQDMLRRDGHRINSYEKKLLSTVVNPDNIKVSFSDLVLPAPTKLMLQTLVTLPMLRPEYFTTGILSRSAIHGVLLFGPPGTGKTMLAKAVAKSSGARFMSVALSDVFDKYVGEGEKNVRAVFTLARRIAPCVVFLDEVDAIFGSRRNDSTSSSRREIMNEFMAEWDGLNSNNNGVIVLGATNRPFDLDDAILRRMPRRVLVDLPNEQARANIIKLLLRDEPTDASVVIQSLAQRTHLYSGSDLKNLCVAAALARVKETIVRDLLRTETGVDADSLSTEAVMSRLEHLDDWSACLEPAKSHGRSQTLSASHASKHASTATPVAASTHGRRQRSSSASASALSTQTQLISASARSMATTEAVTVASPPSWSTSSHASSRAPSEPEALQAMASTSDASETSSSSQPAATTPISGSPLKPLTLAHFEVAFAEVPPSLTDEMATLVELRKWDEMYGDGAARRKNKKRHGWGFDAALPASSSPVSPASPATAVLAEQTQPSASASGQ
ncbi:hypothetical protein BC831DRAFT_440994 [Entophlyctis helioformis]|nr:hypothetical protein BC831DRAFT_440994 [Entophlyctis helioformis]